MGLNIIYVIRKLDSGNILCCYMNLVYLVLFCLEAVTFMRKRGTCLERRIYNNISQKIIYLQQTFYDTSMSYGATVGASAANSKLIKLKT